ncbi:MAG: GIY-YIG nuclease family protein [Pyrinomonadaceae bacterium]
MSNRGFIYILINPSLAGLLKIGKTTRSPESRADELSKATGVPTPFIVAFDEEFDDCDTAERYIHMLLQEKGHRVAANREFFNIPLKEAIKTLLRAKDALGSHEIQPDSAAEAKRHCGELWGDIVDDAKAYLYGLGETLIDVKQALKLFRQAATIGSPEAHIMLAKLHLDGTGCERSVDKALDYLKGAVGLKYLAAYAPMAKLYFETGQYGNAGKCWKKYFIHLSNSGDEESYEAADAVLEFLQQRGRIPNDIKTEIEEMWKGGPSHLHRLLIRAEVIYVISGRFGYPKNKVKESVDQVLAAEGKHTVKSVYESSLNLLRSK